MTKTTRQEPEITRPVKVGDIFVCSWGYDQTNIDFYQVTRLMPSMVEIRKIGQHIVHTAYLQGDCTPCPNYFIDKPKRKKITNWGGNPWIRINSFSSAKRLDPLTVVDGAPVYPVCNWTAYA